MVIQVTDVYLESEVDFRLIRIKIFSQHPWPGIIIKRILHRTTFQTNTTLFLRPIFPRRQKFLFYITAQPSP